MSESVAVNTLHATTGGVLSASVGVDVVDVVDETARVERPLPSGGRHNSEGRSSGPGALSGGYHRPSDASHQPGRGAPSAPEATFAP